MTRSPLPALLRFHFAVGARLAMRLLVPVIATAFGAGMLLGPDFLNSISHVLFGARASGGTSVLFAAVFLGGAAEAAPRVCRGLGGWLRHLPVSGLAHRRAAGFAIALAQLPLLLAFLFLATYASLAPAALLADALKLLVTALAAALCATPVERPWAARPLALIAAVLAGSGGWGTLGIAAALLVAADLAAGSLARSGAPAVHLSRRSVGGLIELRIAWRALGTSLFGAWVLGLLPVGAAFAFTANNALAPEYVRLAARLGAALAIVFVLAQIAEALAVRRPAWPWSRSLPWSAARRAGADALLLGAHALPLVLLVARIDLAALAVLGILPFLAVRAAGAMRRAPERRTGAAGEIFFEGALLAALVALLPWTALLPLAATPWALQAAAERERRQKVSRWLELHHLAAGDPQSWSAS
ncbi:MAG TPA: hypothetical protein VLB76_13670 [Thermoanaerobaculia bacterium]|nr:hypothetical protein [Thermoanaerobaculia bacterium]